MAKIKHGVVRTDLMSGTHDATRLRSVKYMADGKTATDIDNGCVVALDGLMDGEREVYKAVTPKANTALSKIVVIANPEVMYDERLKQLEDYYNEAGKVIRGYIPQKDTDVIAVTAECLEFTGVPAKGWVVELTAGVKMKAVQSATTSSTKIGEIIGIETVGARTYYVISFC